ncbi:hypothetical protein EBZ39_04650 [bacterium]|nr:hypothetical protein [bacterium]
MFRFLMCVVVALFLVSVAHAAPRHRRYYTTPQASTPVKSYSYATSYAGAGHTATAQGVAELQASNGRMGHHGGNAGYEGVGMGSTPEEALGNCCYSNSGRAVVDQGVARGRDGRWYACKRYR